MDWHSARGICPVREDASMDPMACATFQPLVEKLAEKMNYLEVPVFSDKILDLEGLSGSMSNGTLIRYWIVPQGDV